MKKISIIVPVYNEQESLNETIEEMVELVGSSEFESPLPSIARFRRLVYPGHGEVTNRGVLGSKSHGCPVLLV